LPLHDSNAKTTKPSRLDPSPTFTQDSAPAAPQHMPASAATTTAKATDETDPRNLDDSGDDDEVTRR